MLRTVAELLLKEYPLAQIKRAVNEIQAPAFRKSRDYAARWLRAMKSRYGAEPDRAAIHDEIIDIHKITGAVRHIQ